MPHISVKMLKGRTDEQKERLARTLQKSLMESLNCGESHVSVAIEDYTPQQWQDIFKQEITDKEEHLFIKPGYDPKSLL